MASLVGNLRGIRSGVDDLGCASADREVGRHRRGGLVAVALTALAALFGAWWAAGRGFDGDSELAQMLPFLSGLPSVLYTIILVAAIACGVMGGRSLARNFG